MALNMKYIIFSDSESNFMMHISSVEKFLPTFLERDTLKYLW